MGSAQRGFVDPTNHKKRIVTSRSRSVLALAPLEGVGAAYRMKRET